MKGVRLFVAVAALVTVATRAWAYSASYDQTMTNGKETFTSKVYVKDRHMRIESNVHGVQAIMIRNDEGFFNYMPQEGVAMKLPGLNVAQQPVQDVDGYEAYLQKQHAQKIRSETVNGYACDVYQYTDPKGGPITAWVWKEKQFPVRVEMNGPDGHIVAEMSNIQVGVPIDDSKFSLPAGVQPMDMGAMGEGMAGMMGAARGGAGAQGAMGNVDPQQLQQMMKRIQQQQGGDETQ